MSTIHSFRVIISGQAKSKKGRLLAIFIALSSCYITGSLIALYLIADYSIPKLINLLPDVTLLPLVGHVLLLIGSFGASLLFGEIPALIYVFWGKKRLYNTSIALMLVKCILVVISIFFIGSIV